MKVLLVGPNYEENLSIRYLSASLLKSGHDTVLAAFNSPAEMASVAEAARSVDLVGLSMCFQARAKEFLHLAQRIKSHYPGKLIVAGGHYASCAAKELLAHHPEIDIIVIHEGEKTLVEIAEAAGNLERKLPHISGIAYRTKKYVHFTARRAMFDDLDLLPFPDRRGPFHHIAGVPTSYMMGSRGCYGHCAYCCITTLHELAPGKRFRQRSVDNIADEMAALYHQRGTRQFVFHDDNFLVPSPAFNHARLSALQKTLKQRKLRDIGLIIKCRPADADREVLRHLKQLGLVRVFLGVESATERGLSSLDRKQSVDESIRALEACAELDISAQFTLMTFHPDATLDTLRGDIAFMRRFSWNPLNFGRAEIYAGTPLEKRMIEQGRARGNYLARVYSLSDPSADLACNIALDLFNARCWSAGSLMQRAIGVDHMAAVLKRFYRGPEQAALVQRIGTWLHSVNLDTVTLLEEVVELSASGRTGPGFQRTIESLKERESATRQEFMSVISNLLAELETLRYAGDSNQTGQIPVLRLRIAKQVAAAVLAIGLPTTPLLQQAAAQNEKTQASAAHQNLCSLAGVITDPTGAVISKAKITIRNVETGLAHSFNTDASGRYSTDDLTAGTYDLTVESPGFKTAKLPGIVLKAGQPETKDIALEIGNIGCCEYVASPMQIEQPDWTMKKKPFTYYVGDAKDRNTFQGIAKVVYRNPRMWVQIFEANRDVAEKPGSSIPNGTAVTIPARRRAIPKLKSKVLPVYPPEASNQQVSGDVVMDVTIKPDGTVDQVGVVDSPSQLVDAATSAVKRWRYEPPSKGQAIKFVVVVSFDKHGKVH